MRGIKYAIEQLTSKVPKDNLMDFMRILRRMDLPFRKMRGFATNVANCQPLGAEMCPFRADSGNRNGYCLNGRHSGAICCADACGLLRDWSVGNNKLNYAQQLAVTARAVLGMDAHMVVDTGRNGQTSMCEACKDWCNIRGAGAGEASTTATAAPRLVDAYFWLKTPGESDGCTETLPSGGLCPRFDPDCASVDSIGSRSGEPRAPEVKQLAQNAEMR